VSPQANPSEARSAGVRALRLTPAFYDDWFVKRDRCGVIL